MDRIIVLAPKKPFLGAQLVQLPFLSELRARHPRSRIMLALPFSGSSIFEEFRFHDDLVTGWAESSGGTAGFVRRIIRFRPDGVFSLRARSARSGLVALLSGARRRVGYDLPGNRFFFTEQVRPREQVYLGLKYLDLLGERRREMPKVALWTREVEKEVEAVFAERGLPSPRVGLIVGAGREKKRWPAQRFAALAAGIRAAVPRAVVVFFLSPREASGTLGRDLSEIDPRLRFSFQGLGSLACALSRCRALVSSDCGPAHLGHLLGVPQVVLFDGTGRPREWFLPRPGAVHLMAAGGKPVASLGVSGVLGATLEVLRSVDPAPGPAVG